MKLFNFHLRSFGIKAGLWLLAWLWWGCFMWLFDTVVIDSAALAWLMFLFYSVPGLLLSFYWHRAKSIK